MSLAWRCRCTEKERRAIREKPGRGNETTWQGIRAFGEAASKKASGNSEGKNRNGNLVQSKGFLLIAASGQVWSPLKSKIAGENWNAEHAFNPTVDWRRKKFWKFSIVTHDAGQKSFEEEENETYFSV